MAKTLEFTTKSPRQIKQGDTETTFTFICKNDGSVVDLTKATNITAKIGNASGYLRSQSIAINSLATLNQGWLNLQPMPDLISGLPAGDYQLEIWVVDQAGTSIYPSDKPLGFTITNNIENEGGATITTITFDDFVEAMNKAASTIAKGDKGDDGLSAYQVAVINGYKGSQTDWLASLKGDTGTVDNAGLTTAPAFVALQTQVNNSAVGTNLLINSSSSSINGRTQIPGASPAVGGVNKYSRTDSYEQVTAAGNVEFYYRFMSPSITNLYGLTPGGTYTLSGSASHTSGELKFRSEYGAGGGYYQSLGNPSDLGIPVSDGSVFIPFSYTFTVPVGATGIYISLQNDDYTAGGLFRFKNMKLEKGSVATDWCPNPSEILTQADYAKIQAAIVALGGALS
ncbi:hypothetical protein ACWYXE_12705 [Lactiplantibacillus argentoratensis]